MPGVCPMTGTYFGTIAISDNSPSGLVPSLRSSFHTLIPPKPYCADYLEQGLRIRSREAALTRRHVQMNGPMVFKWMLHDVDTPGAALAYRDAYLPEPNIVVVNPDNGHAHTAYLLATGVARSSNSRLRPLKFFAAVERGFARRFGADRHYSGLVTKNPMHPDWRVEWHRDEPYTLHELADWLFPRDMAAEVEPEHTIGAGRNCTVFEQLRAIAYREVRSFKSAGATFGEWRTRCTHIALGLNHQFPIAMMLAEVRAIAGSVAKWTWKHFSEDSFRALQSHRGKIGNATRWAGHQAANNTKPWAAMGISRRTYYRRQASGAF